MLKIFKIKF